MPHTHNSGDKLKINSNHIQASQEWFFCIIRVALQSADHWKTRPKNLFYCYVTNIKGHFSLTLTIYPLTTIGSQHCH